MYMTVVILQLNSVKIQLKSDKLLLSTEVIKLSFVQSNHKKTDRGNAQERLNTSSVALFQDIFSFPTF